jgi:hypothetical protein
MSQKDKEDKTKIIAKGQSPLKELEVDPRSGPYLFVTLNVFHR